MTLALLLDQTGELDLWQLRCSECSASDKRLRGCGRAPMAPRFSPQGEYLGQAPFTPRYLHEQAALNEADVIEDFAEQLWPHADRGEAVSVTGSVWRCCPAWYARFSSASARKAANDAFELHAWREHSSISAIRSTPLQPWHVTLIGVVSRAVDAFRRRDHDRKHPPAPTEGG